MRAVSAKRAKRLREVSPFRKNYLAAHPKCAVFSGFPSEEIHEITSGANRDASLDEPAAILAVSRRGHEQIQHEPKAKQLARKLLATPDEFDLDKINELCAVKGDEDVPKRFILADIVPYLRVWPGVSKELKR